MASLRGSRSALVVAAVAAVALAAGLTARHLLAPRAPPPTPVAKPRPGWIEPELVLRVPHAPGAILLDGDTDDKGWTGNPPPARTRAFVTSTGVPARPFSEIRMVWGDGYLYLSLYAADEDIEAHVTEPDGPVWNDDSFRVVFTRDDTQYAIEVSASAVVTDSIRRGGGKWDYTWSAGVHASKEADGSLNNPRNRDEEWVIEMAVPFESLGLEGKPGESLGFTASRCDTPKDGQRVCASWGEGTPAGRIVLE